MKSKSKRKPRLRSRGRKSVDRQSSPVIKPATAEAADPPKMHVRSTHKLGIPMRHRKLPASFWQQPARPSVNIQQRVGPVQQLLETRTMLIKIPSPPDTNLLFSLFKILEQSAASAHHHHQHRRKDEVLQETTTTISKSNSNTDTKKATNHQGAGINFNNNCETSNNKPSIINGQQQQHVLMEFADDEPNRMSATDDPYLCKEYRRIDEKKSLLKGNDNLSDLLTDLVVNL